MNCNDIDFGIHTRRPPAGCTTWIAAMADPAGAEVPEDGGRLAEVGELDFGCVDWFMYDPLTIGECLQRDLERGRPSGPSPARDAGQAAGLVGEKPGSPQPDEAGRL